MQMQIFDEYLGRGEKKQEQGKTATRREKLLVANSSTGKKEKKANKTLKKRKTP